MPFRLLCGLDIDKFPPDIFPDDSTVVVDSPLYHEDGRKLILLMHEPEAITPARAATLENGHRFHKIYTCDAEVLKAFPNTAVRMLGNYTRMSDDEIASVDVTKKEFKISSWAGSKNAWPAAHGHRLRQLLYFNQSLFPPNVFFYRSVIPFNGQVLPDVNNTPSLDYESKVNILKDFQFAVTIENSRQENFFTEKLIDCLIMKTIPIYWGCPNVSEFFDTTGWILFETPEELFIKLKGLDEGHYARHLAEVDKNFQEALKYADFYKNFERQARG
jgi:hypothetical protein